MSRPATFADLDAAFDGASGSVLRIEARGYYEGDDANVTAGRIPDRTPANNPYLAEVSAHAGRRIDRVRVRVIGDPPTPYERWELPTLAANWHAGELVCVAPLVELDQHRPTDAWIFDGRRAIVMHYSDAGAVERLELLEHPTEVAEVLDTYSRLVQRATLLPDYLTAPAVRRAG